MENKKAKHARACRQGGRAQTPPVSNPPKPPAARKAPTAAELIEDDALGEQLGADEDHLPITRPLVGVLKAPSSLPMVDV